MRVLGSAPELFNLDEVRVRGIGFRERRGLELGEHVEAPAPVESLLVGPVPCALREGNEARNDPRRHLDGEHECAAVVEDANEHARLEAPGLRIDGIHQNDVGMRFAQPRHVVIGRVRAAGTVVAEGLKRILLRLRVHLNHFVRRHVARDRMNLLSPALGQLPGAGDLGKTFGIDLDPAARGLERMLVGIPAEVLHDDPAVALHAVLVDAGPAEFVPGGHAGEVLPRLGVKPAHPALEVEPLGVGGLAAEASGEPAHDLPVGLLLPLGIDRLVAEHQVVLVAHGIGVGHEVDRLLMADVGEHVVGEHGRGRHLRVDADDRLDLRLVLEDRTELVDAAVLVDERVRLGVPDELDVVPEGRRAAHGGGFGRERGGVDDGLRPQEDGHAHLDGVGARGQTGFKAVGVAYRSLTDCL